MAGRAAAARCRGNQSIGGHQHWTAPPPCTAADHDVSARVQKRLTARFVRANLVIPTVQLPSETMAAATCRQLPQARRSRSPAAAANASHGAARTRGWRPPRAMALALLAALCARAPRRAEAAKGNCTFEKPSGWCNWSQQAGAWPWERHTVQPSSSPAAGKQGFAKVTDQPLPLYIISVIMVQTEL